MTEKDNAHLIKIDQTGVANGNFDMDTCEILCIPHRKYQSVDLSLTEKGLNFNLCFAEVRLHGDLYSQKQEAYPEAVKLGEEIAKRWKEHHQLKQKVAELEALAEERRQFIVNAVEVGYLKEPEDTPVNQDTYSTYARCQQENAAAIDNLKLSLCSSLSKEKAELIEQNQAQAEFITDIRWAVGDKGKRMQSDLLEWLQSCTLVTPENGTNRYGLDVSYFRNTIDRELNRSLTDFKPDELARVCARLAKTADSEVLKESEFSPENEALEPLRNSAAMALDHVRCGIGGNFGGERYNQEMTRVYDPLVKALRACLFKPGDVVEPTSNAHQLRSGCQSYSSAIVAKSDPFTLISEEGDMRWESTVQPENFIKTGRASPAVMTKVNARLERG